VVVIVGETGSGKTTQIPQYMWEAGPHSTTFADFRCTSNGGQRVSLLRPRVNRPSDLPYNDTIWRTDGLFPKNWRPPFEVPWKPAKTASSASPGATCRLCLKPLESSR
jgi:hypothetical protein